MNKHDREKFFRDLRRYTKKLVGLGWECPFKWCRGKIELIKAEQGGTEITTPRGFKPLFQYRCKRCGSHFMGTSAQAVSKLRILPAQQNRWRHYNNFTHVTGTKEKVHDHGCRCDDPACKADYQRRISNGKGHREED